MLNKVILIGRLTRDPEIKQTASGVSVCSFSLAVQRDYARQGEERQTDFINITSFRQTAEFVAKYFKKGQLMGVCGRLQQRSWQDNEGKNRSVVEVLVDEVHFSGTSTQNTPNTASTDTAADNQAAPQGFTYDYSESDLPF